MKTKFNYIIGIACMVVSMMTSCYSDDSTAWTQEVAGITIEGMESAYTSTAYVGEHLVVNPTITTGFSDADMEYRWLLINEKTGTTDENGNTIEPDTIGKEKSLDYEVNLAPGQYQLRLYARNLKNDYLATAYASLSVQTDFSQGFYILKETAEGNTELDMVNSKNVLSENLLQKVKGITMQGKPLNLSPAYDVAYVDEETDEMKENHALVISSHSRDFCILRVTDLATIKDKSNLYFDEAPAGEVPFSYIPGIFGITLVTSGGFYETGGGGTGQFGLPVVEGKISPYHYYDYSSYGGGAHWDEGTHSLMSRNYNNRVSGVTDWSGNGELTQNLTNFDCIFCGYSDVASVEGQFILRDNTNGDRYLYQLSGGFSGQYLKSRTKLAAGSHMANADYYACNSISASYIYCVDGGKLYACVVNSDNLDEVEIKPEGIPASEQINFVANQFCRYMGGDSFNYLIVGTQSGNNYKLYFYEMNGGAPAGQPINTVQGTGKVKKLRYINQSYSSSYVTYYYCFNAYCD